MFDIIAKQSINADNAIKKIMNDYNIEYKEIDQDNAVKNIVDELTKQFPL